jgi:hypothetical protein
LRRGTALGVGILLAIGALQALPAAGDTPPAPAPVELPRAACAEGITDVQGDAAPDYVGGHQTSGVITNKPPLDIRSVDLRLTSDQLQVFMSIDGAINEALMEQYEASYRYTVTFTFSGKNFTYGIELRNSGNKAQPLDGTSYPMMVMGSGANLPDSTAGFRHGEAPEPDWVVFTSSRAGVEKALGRPIDAGEKFTNIAGLTQVWTSRLVGKADDTSETAVAKATYAAGDDSCFGPPPTKLGSLKVTSAEWSDSSALSAVLVDETGKPLEDEPVTFTISDGTGTTVDAVTDANGVATASYGPIRLHAASYPVTVEFPGDDDNKSSVAAGALKVTVERCSFSALQVTKPSASSRVVTATLLDDDRHPVAGVKVDWWVNGKKASTVTSSKTGVIQLRNAKPGQSVQARYAGAAGTLTAATSKIAKV